MCSLLPLGTTGRICRKSPPSTTVIPPNGFSLLFWFVNLSISLRLLSSASKQFLFAIGASSQIIIEVFFSSSARWVPCLISHVDSSVMLSGILNLECAVLPPGISKAAIAHDATASTIFPSDRSFVVMAFHRYVFPVPPWPSTNICFPSPFSTDSIIASYAFFLLRIYVFEYCL